MFIIAVSFENQVTWSIDTRVITGDPAWGVGYSNLPRNAHEAIQQLKNAGQFPCMPDEILIVGKDVKQYSQVKGDF